MFTVCKKYKHIYVFVFLIRCVLVLFHFMSYDATKSIPAKPKNNIEQLMDTKWKIKNQTYSFQQHHLNADGTQTRFLQEQSDYTWTDIFLDLFQIPMWQWGQKHYIMLGIICALCFGCCCYFVAVCIYTVNQQRRYRYWLSQVELLKPEHPISSSNSFSSK